MEIAGQNVSSEAAIKRLDLQRNYRYRAEPFGSVPI